MKLTQFCVLLPRLAVSVKNDYGPSLHKCVSPLETLSTDGSATIPAYDTDMTCTWLLSTGASTRAKVTFRPNNEAPPPSLIPGDTINVHDGDIVQAPVLVTVTSSTIATVGTVTGSSNRLVVVFKSGVGGQGNGFSFTVGQGTTTLDLQSSTLAVVPVHLERGPCSTYRAPLEDVLRMAWRVCMPPLRSQCLPPQIWSLRCGVIFPEPDHPWLHRSGFRDTASVPDHAHPVAYRRNRYAPGA